MSSLNETKEVAFCNIWARKYTFHLRSLDDSLSFPVALAKQILPQRQTGGAASSASQDWDSEMALAARTGWKKDQLGAIQKHFDPTPH